MKRIFARGTAMPTSIILILLLWIPIHSFAANPPSHSHEAILSAATQFAADAHANAIKTDISIHPLDNRLRLAQCSTELILFWPPGATQVGQTTVGVRCDGQQPWRIYVRAMISVFDSIAVLSRSVIAGDVLSPDAVTLSIEDMSRIREDVVKDIEPLIGYRFKRKFASGRALTRSMVSAPRLVQKGDDVFIVSQVGQLKVRVKGVALTDGEQGAMVQARNSTSERVIQGQVISRGVIQVAP